MPLLAVSTVRRTPAGRTLGRMIEVADTDDARLLSAAIDHSGLSVVKFARLIVRDPRNVYRWLKGENPLPASVRERCRELLAAPPPSTE